MGHSKASKANTHARLVQTAAARFKEHGVDGIGLADLMKELDLTHGGFYKHFASREDLVTEALDRALTDSAAAMRQRLFDGNKPDLAGFVNFYLGENHRDSRAEGCAVAALSGDAARKSADVQAQFREHVAGNIQALSEVLSAESETEPGTAASDSSQSRANAIFVLSALYGALIMARTVGNSELSNEILRTVRKRLLNGDAAPRKAPAPAKRSAGNSAKRSAKKRNPIVD